ncbi:hypothetical protein I6F11_29605 [Ensifer sp. NBAIM29]|nr:hypothetical protein [Ensifer sp. NBAIM29]
MQVKPVFSSSAEDQGQNISDPEEGEVEVKQRGKYDPPSRRSLVEFSISPCLGPVVEHQKTQPQKGLKQHGQNRTGSDYQEVRQNAPPAPLFDFLNRRLGIPCVKVITAGAVARSIDLVGEFLCRLKVVSDKWKDGDVPSCIHAIRPDELATRGHCPFFVQCEKREPRATRGLENGSPTQFSQVQGNRSAQADENEAVIAKRQAGISEYRPQNQGCATAS